MNVVDSSGWLEYLADGPNAGAFARPIESTATLIVPTLSLYEVFKRVRQQRDEDEALRAIAVMEQGRVIDLDRATALEAARLSLLHGIALADAVMLATAQRHAAMLWTQDSEFDGLPGAKYIPKKNAP
ncbi:MAG: type II toxin-antitoxin system VapC family toxin [Pseudomonadota bacterium]